MNIFTVDVEDWFHVCGVGGPLDRAHWETLPSRVESTTRRMLDALAAAGVPATFFVVGWIAERYPSLVREIVAAGHVVGSHSHWHRRVYDLAPAEFVEDLRASCNAIVAAGAPRPTAFRAAEWSVNERSLWALDVLVAEGISVDASMAPVPLVGHPGYRRRPYVRQTSAGSLVEVPPFVADRFGHTMPMGWGWGLRMTSPTRVLSYIEAANRQGVPAVLTVHPWEVDPAPPFVWLPPRLLFAHYFRLGGFERRLKEIMHGTTFTTLRATVTCAAAS